VLGKVLFVAGVILILGAVFARAGMLSINAQRTQAGLPALQKLADAYPRHAAWRPMHRRPPAGDFPTMTPMKIPVPRYS
jgi:hypothetical protein